jgi:hypothetical protein
VSQKADTTAKKSKGTIARAAMVNTAKIWKQMFCTQMDISICEGKQNDTPQAVSVELYRHHNDLRTSSAWHEQSNHLHDGGNQQSDS